MIRFPRRSLLVAAALVVAGCLSPTLPLPPPSPDVNGPNAQGEIEISGNTRAGALVYAVNLKNNQISGEITGDNGHYDFFLAAQVGDQVEVYVQIGQDTSQPYAFVVKP